MRELTIRIPDDLFVTVRKLLQHVRGVEVVRSRKLPAAPLTADQQEFVDDLRQSLREVEQHQRGEIKLPTMRDFLNEVDG